MKKYKKQLSTIGEVTAFLLIYIGYIVFENSILSALGIILIFVFWISNIIEKIKYRKGKLKNQFRYPTSNDNYYKITSLVLGLVLLGGSIWFISWKSSSDWVLIGILIAGVLVFVNGLIDIPKGIIQIEHDTVTISGLEEKIKIQKIEQFEKVEDQLNLKLKNQTVKKIDMINSSPAILNNLKLFLEEHRIPIVL